MKKFRFSLEAVLKWKRSQEEDALKLFGLAMQRRAAAMETLQNARRCLGELLKTIREARQGKIEGWAQIAYAREVARQEALCKNFEELLERAKIEEVKAREFYLSRHREAEAMERLREKRYEMYEKDAERAIERELEEIMLSRGGNALCS